jgi:hypothetical protein
MSLRSFHVVFIAASTLLAFFFAAWCFGLDGHEPGAGWLTAGIASAACGLGLVAYEAWFLRKTRGLS